MQSIIWPESMDIPPKLAQPPQSASIMNVNIKGDEIGDNFKMRQVCGSNVQPESHRICVSSMQPRLPVSDYDYEQDMKDD